MQCLRLYRVDGRETTGEESADAELSTPCVLGRGPVLRCAEKKISRRHLILEWDQKALEVVITSVHQNPCFVKGKHDLDVRMLNTNDSAALSPGDKFGLFKESFWFRVDYNVPQSNSKLTAKATIDQDTKELHSEEKLKEQNSKVSTPEPSPEPRPSTDHDFRDTVMTGSSTSKNHKNEPSSPTKELMDGEEEEARPGIEVVEDKPKVEAMEVTPPQQETYVPVKRVRQLPDWMMAEERESPKEKIETKKLHGGGHKKQSKKGAPAEKKTQPKPQTKEAKSPKRATPTKASAPRPSNKKSPIKAKVQHEVSDSEEEETNSALSPVKKNPTKLISPKRASRRGETDEEEEEKTIPKISPRKRRVSPLISDPVMPQTKEAKSPKRATPAKAAAPRPSNKKSPIKAKIQHEMSDSEEEETNSDLSPVKENPTKLISPKQASRRGETDEEEEEKTIPKMSPRKRRVSPSGDISDSGSDGGNAKRWTITHVNSGASSPTPATVPSDSNNTNPVPQAQVRPSCNYGAKCYRKNTDHKEAFAHPGDQDYDSSPEPDSDDDDTRPECEYGLSCYRKNPKHQKAYKHTRAVQPQRRAKKKARKIADDDSDDDGSDLDSFIYDGSSDDYAPTDEDSDSPMEVDVDEEEEDSKRLLKEAKKFVRKRK